jgi:carbon storage regulator
MLVLSRKLNQTILLGQDIRITVLAIDGNDVKLGIDAPRNITVLRQEVVKAVVEENRRASRSTNFAEAAKTMAQLTKKKS